MNGDGDGFHHFFHDRREEGRRLVPAYYVPRASLDPGGSSKPGSVVMLAGGVPEKTKEKLRTGKTVKFRPGKIPPGFTGTRS